MNETNKMTLHSDVYYCDRVLIGYRWNQEQALSWLNHGTSINVNTADTEEEITSRGDKRGQPESV